MKLATTIKISRTISAFRQIFLFDCILFSLFYFELAYVFFSDEF